MKDEGRAKAAQSQAQARCRPPASQELGSCSLVFLLCCSCAPLVLLLYPSCVALVSLLCCSCFPLVLRWCPPPHHGRSVEPQVGIDCLGRLVIHMQSDLSINPLRSAVLRPSRSKATLGRRQKDE